MNINEQENKKARSELRATRRKEKAEAREAKRCEKEKMRADKTLARLEKKEASIKEARERKEAKAEESLDKRAEKDIERSDEAERKLKRKMIKAEERLAIKKEREERRQNKKSARAAEKEKKKAKKTKAQRISEFKLMRAALGDEDRDKLDRYFADFRLHCRMPKRETTLLREDIENALLYYVSKDVSLDEALGRLSNEKLGGFYAHPSTLWFPLDDAAKIYPFSMNEGYMNMYRLAMNMDEDVVPELLQMALSFTIKRFPSFATTLKKGVFWHYLDSTKRRFTVHEAKDIPCTPIPISQSGSQSFRVLYYKNRISVEFFHILTDGTGAVAFLRALVSEYLRLLGYEGEPDETLIDISEAPSKCEIMNEFAHVEKPKNTGGFIDKMSLQMSGTLSSTIPCRIIHFKMDSEKLKAAARTHGAPVTSYVLALMFIASSAATEEMSGDINIQVPVNMRKYYPSRTLRNFSMYAGIRIPIESITTVDDMLPTITEQMQTKTSKEAMSAMVASTNKLVNGIKLIPLSIKAPVAKVIYGFLGEKIFTTTLSNLGVVTMPRGFAEHIKDMEFTLGASRTNKAICSIITYGGKTTLTVTKNTVSPIFEEKLCALLEREGLMPSVEGSPLYEY